MPGKTQGFAPGFPVVLQACCTAIPRLVLIFYKWQQFFSLLLLNRSLKLAKSRHMGKGMRETACLGPILQILAIVASLGRICTLEQPVLRPSGPKWRPEYTLGVKSIWPPVLMCAACLFIITGWQWKPPVLCAPTCLSVSPRLVVASSQTHTVAVPFLFQVCDGRLLGCHSRPPVHSNSLDQQLQTGLPPRSSVGNHWSCRSGLHVRQ